MSKRAIVYARVSTEDQAEYGYSLRNQVELCHSYAEKHDFTMVREFVDPGVSGSLPMDARPAGIQLLEAIKRQDADAIIVATSDRLSRDLAHFLVLRQQWHRAGIELHYVDRGRQENTPEARLSQNVEAVITEYEREKIRMRTMQGKRRKVKDGRWLGVHTPYGYRRKGKGRDATIYVYEPEAEIVRRIFAWYVSGTMSLAAIAERLESEGIRTPTGNTHWARGSLRKILGNEIYSGSIFYGKTRLVAEEYETQPTWERVQAMPRELWTRVDLPELALVDQATFEAAQARAARNKELSRRNRSGRYLLSGFLKCGHCDHAMGGTRSTKRKKDGTKYAQYFYRCPNRDCEAKTRTIVTHRLDDEVWSSLVGVLGDEGQIKRGVYRLAEKREQELEPKRQRLGTVDDLVGQAERSIKRLAAEFAGATDEVIADALREQMQATGKQREALARERELLIAELDQREMSKEKQAAILKMAAEITQKLGTDPGMEHKRALLEALEVEVEFWRLDERRIRVNWAIAAGITVYLDDVVSTHSWLGSHGTVLFALDVSLDDLSRELFATVLARQCTP